MATSRGPALVAQACPGATCTPADLGTGSPHIPAAIVTGMFTIVAAVIAAVIAALISNLGANTAGSSVPASLSPQAEASVPSAAPPTDPTIASAVPRSPITVTLHDLLSDGATSETALVRIGNQSASLTADVNHPDGSTSLVLPSAGSYSVELQVDVYDMSGTARTLYGSDTITVTADSEFHIYGNAANEVYLRQVY